MRIEDGKDTGDVQWHTFGDRPLSANLDMAILGLWIRATEISKSPAIEHLLYITVWLPTTADQGGRCTSIDCT